MSAGAFAEEALSLEKSRQAALANSKTLQKYLLAVDTSVLAEKSDSYDKLPSVSASAGASWAYAASGTSSGLSGSLGLSVSQLVYDGGKTSLLAAIDAISTKIARQEARGEYLGVLEAADEAFYAALEAQASLEAAKADLDAYAEHLRLAKAKLEAGMITKYECLQTEAEAAAKETAYIQAQGALSSARSVLGSLTGISGGYALEDVDFSAYENLIKRASAYSGDTTSSLIEDLCAKALANNPTILAASLTESQARKTVALAKADYLPDISAGVSHSFGLEEGKSPDAGIGSISLSASIPLDFWVTKASVASKELSVRTAELDGAESLCALKLDIESAVYDYASAARSVLSSRKALEYAENYRESVLELYRLSAAASSELSDAEALASSSRSALISSRYEFLTSLSALRTFAGLESDELLLALLP